MRSIGLLLIAAALSFPPAAFGASGPAALGQAPPSPPNRSTIAEQLAAIAESLNLLAVRQRTGGDVSGPLGRNCVEARTRMRWSNLPCSPDHLPPLAPVPVDDPY
ncbi:MAG: hypothetical protein ACE147_15380 [Candidatus Methylomirabilales bacterium]